MSRAKKPRSVSIRHELEIEISPLPFVPFRSLQALDLERLARSRHDVVELGQFEAGCCKRTARAVIERGRVTAIEVDACAEGTTKATPEMAKVIARARAKLDKATSPPPRLPMPVARFFRRNRRGEIELVITSICTRTCIDFFGTSICTICCTLFEPGGRERIVCSSIVSPF